jgi:small subunit ribosomal protein S9
MEETVTPVIEVATSFSFESAKTNMAGKTFREVIGRRKTAIARVRVMLEKKLAIIVNGKDVAEYFPVPLYLAAATAPLAVADVKEGLAFTIVVNGGGQSSQAEAIRHGIARALVFLDPSVRTILKRAGHLKRDPRKKERKKPGLKKARKSAQWSKR